MPAIPAKRAWILAGVGLLAITAVIVIGLLLTQALNSDEPGDDIHPTAPVETAPAETPPVSSPRPVVPADE